MDSKTFTEFREQFNAECEAILANRAPLYSTDDDRLVNFKRNATGRVTPLDVWRIYAGKHWDSICSTVDALAGGRILVEQGQDLFGSFRDLRNYLDLGVALIAELIATRPDMFKLELEPGDVVHTPYGDGWVICRYHDPADGYRVAVPGFDDHGEPTEAHHTLPRAGLIYQGARHPAPEPPQEPSAARQPDPDPPIPADRKVAVLVGNDAP
jgi:hypothetical protein